MAAREGSGGFAGYCVATAVAFVAFVALAALGFAQNPAFPPIGGLMQRLCLAAGFAWRRSWRSARRVSQAFDRRHQRPDRLPESREREPLDAEALAAALTIWTSPDVVITPRTRISALRRVRGTGLVVTARNSTVRRGPVGRET